MHNFRIVLLSITAFAVLTATHGNDLQAQAVPTQAPLQTAPPTAIPQPQQIQAPSFIPLADNHVAYVDKVLLYWQQRTEKVHLYRTKFQRWQFDTVYGPANTFKTFSTGKIQYAEPDKGLFKVEEVLSYHAAVSPATKPSYKAIPGVHGEYWVCDGKSIFEYDYNNQKLIQQILPAELQGQNIINGPLPFLFGSNAADIKISFWVR